MSATISSVSAAARSLPSPSAASRGSATGGRRPAAGAVAVDGEVATRWTALVPWVLPVSFWAEASAVSINHIALCGMVLSLTSTPGPRPSSSPSPTWRKIVPLSTTIDSLGSVRSIRTGVPSAGGLPVLRKIAFRARSRL